MTLNRVNRCGQAGAAARRDLFGPPRGEQNQQG